MLLLERIVAIFELVCSGLQTSLTLQSLGDILQIRLNMPPVSKVDLRSAIREFIETSRDREVSIEKH